MIGFLRKLVGGLRGFGRVRASYDAAQTTPDNRRHWANADNLGPILAAARPSRDVLRKRARYEYANNSYCRGIVNILAQNMIGKGGPQLQVQTPDQGVNRWVEASFAAWAKAAKLTNTLRVMKQAKVVDGETFVLFKTSDAIALQSGVALDLKVLESDQVATPFPMMQIGQPPLDGIEFDPASGEPLVYHVLRHHPGDYFVNPFVFDRVPARQVLHWFRDDRPGQPRGLSELTPALELFAQLRRFTLATLDAAETAAHFSAVLKSTLPPNDDDDAAEGAAFDEIEIARRMMATLPTGYEMQQFKAEHPTTSHEMFVMVLLREIARCLLMPWNVAAGDSSKSNFASARLDYLIYRQAVEVEREDCESEVLEPGFGEWLYEATRIPGLLPPNLPAFAGSVPHVWHWPAWEPIDLLTEEQAAETGLRSGTETLASILGQRGRDWRTHIRQQVEEELYRSQVRKELGVQAPAPAPNQPGVTSDAQPAQTA